MSKKTSFLRLLIPATLVLALSITLGCATQTGSTPEAKAAHAATAEGAAEAAGAPQDSEADRLQLNPAVRHGTLENGLTYYVQQNSRPEDRVQLRLVINAGSVLEEDEERGLAHFVEHMAFNGTEKYEKDAIIDYLEKTGMSFGPDINASTSFDQTIYKLDLPSGGGFSSDPSSGPSSGSGESGPNTNTLETGVDILKEWAFNIAFAPEEVENEKGVIIEEWRGARGAAARMRDEYLPVLFRNSRYAERLPIGEMDVIRAATAADLKDFYKKWYRPELMAVIAVGAVDPQKMEQLIKETFGPGQTIQPAGGDQHPERPSYSVPPAEGRQFAIATDPEAQRTQIQVLSLHEPFRLRSEQDYKTSLILSMYSQMVRARLAEKTEQSDPPYVTGYFASTNYLRNNDATVWGALAREGQIERALTTLLEEERRISLYGFTENELQRAKDNLRSRMQRIHEEREKTESSSFASEYIRHYLAGEAAPGIEKEWELTQKYLPEITLADIKQVRTQFIRSGGAKTAIITGPEKEGLQYPGEQELAEIFNRADNAQVEPYRDELAGDQLLKELPQPGSIDTEKTITIPAGLIGPQAPFISNSDSDSNSNTDGSAATGAGKTAKAITYHQFTLANGAKVVYRHTDYKNEEILFSAFSPGGASQVETEDYYAAAMAASFVQASGLGDYSPSQLRKLTAGKQAQVSPYINDLTEGFRGNARPEDLELLFQQIYLYFTAPRRDSELFQSYQQRLQGVLENRRSNPQVLLSDTVTKLLIDDHPRRQPYTAERIAAITEAQVYRIFSERFASPGDFTFTFAGNIDPQELKRLAALYLGSTGPKESTGAGSPASTAAGASSESWIDRGVRYTDTDIREEIRAGIAEKSTVTRIYAGSYDWSLQNNSTLQSLQQLLEIRLREKVREEAGGTYGVGVSVSPTRYPTERYMIAIRFNCDPDRVEELNSIIDTELAALAESPVDPSYIHKVRSIRTKSLEEALQTNGFWRDKLESIQLYDLDPRTALAVRRRIQSTSADSLRQAVRTYIDGATTIEAVLYPENFKE